MERKINNVAFSPEKVEAGAVKDLLNYLLDYNSNHDYNDYYEIHITTDGYCTIVEFEKVPYDGDWGGKFEYIDEDHLVVKEVQLPDNTYELAIDEAHEQDILDEFLAKNPGWSKNNFGRWVYEDPINIEVEKDIEVRNKLVEDLKGRHDNE